MHWAKNKKIRGIDFDPNAGFKDGTRQAWNKGLSKETSETIRKHAEDISSKKKSGVLPITGAGAWDYEKRREHALKNNFGGYNSNAGRSKKFKYKDTFGNEICLQSSFELQCARLLDDMDIKWIRPKHIKYLIDGKTKKYFPDFFLVDYNVYLDPKNNYLAKLDTNKIKLVSEQNNVRIEILTQEKITEEYICRITQR